MGNRNKLIISFLPLLLIVSQVSAEECNCEGYFCIGDNRYQLCQDGKIASDLIPCDPGITCKNETGNECSRQRLCQKSLDDENSSMKIRDICRDEVSHADPEDCQRFYKCTGNGTGELVSCPPDTYYNENTFTCTTDKPERCGSKHSQNEQFECPGVGLFADPENCWRYYECDEWNNSFLKNCPEGTCFDEKIEGCTTNISPRCSDEKPTTDDIASTTQTNQDTTFTESTVQTTVIEESTTDNTEETETEKITISTTLAPPKYDENGGFVCPDEGLFPDIENCHRYYICDSFEGAISMTCPNDTYYDEETTFCSSSKPERCRVSGNKPDNVFTSTTASTTTVGTITTTRQPQSRFECPGEGYFADPNNCHKYFACYYIGDSYIVQSINCLENTYFEEENAFCSPELPERCSGRPSTSTTLRPPNYNENYPCPGDGYYPDPDDCTKYYMCYRDEVIQYTCPRGTYFEDEDDFCTKEIPERCRDSDEDSERPTTPSYSERPTTDKDNNRFTCPGEGYYPDPQNCHYYYVCYELAPPMSVLCPDNTYFDEEYNFCSNEVPERCRLPGRPPENHITTTRPPATTERYPDNHVTTTLLPPMKEDFNCPGEGYYPDPKNCQNYYVCFADNHFIQLSCPSSTFYDEESSFCVNYMPDRCRRIERPSEDNSYTTTPRNDLADDFVCPREGYFPDPKDCRRYYACFGFGAPSRIKCPRGTYFDERGFCTLKRQERCSRDIPHHPSKPSRFTCREEGYFADPYDCRSYHICYSLDKSEQMRCPGKSYYHQSIKGCAPERPDTCRTEDNENKFVCSEEGYFPDPRDCTRYYNCTILGDPVLKNCPENEYFNENIRGCSSEVPPWCQSLTQPSENEFICTRAGYHPDPDDCSVYHICNIFGGRYTSSCPSNTYYHEDTRTCSPIIPDRCIYLRNTRFMSNDVKNNQNKSFVNDLGNPLNQTFVCPGRGLFSDSYNCRKFYVCYGQPRAVYCGGNTYFNEYLQQCVEDMPARCSVSESDRVPSPPGTQPGEFNCPDSGLFPDPRSCHRFYVCYGQPRLVTCHNGLYYSEETQQCEEEMPERCKNNQNDQVTQPPISQPGEFVCPGYGLFSDPEDCRKFYACFGEQRHITCRDGLYFHEDKQECDADIPSRCRPQNDQPPTTMETPTTPREVFECRSPGRYPDPLDCQRFYVCNWRQEAIHYYCKNSMYFNNITNKCEPRIPERCLSDEDRVTTTPKTPSKFVCTETGRFPDPENCLNYYYCSDEDSRPIRYSCPANEFFNSYKGKCKKIKTGNECPNANSGKLHSDNRDSDEDYNDDDDDDDEDDEVEDFQCKQPGIFPDLRDCKRFYVCTSSLKMIHKTCNGRTYFNEIYGHCSILTTPRCQK